MPARDAPAPSFCAADTAAGAGMGDSMRERLDRIVTSIASGLTMIGAIGVVAMLLHINGYVILRLFMSSPIPATVEIVSGYYMVIVAFLPLAWAERRGDMISIEVFAGFFRGPVGIAVDLFVAAVTAAVYFVLTWTTWLVAMREFQAGTFVMSLSHIIPTWPGYFALPLGFALAFLVSLYRLVTLLFPAAPEARP